MRLVQHEENDEKFWFAAETSKRYIPSFMSAEEFEAEHGHEEADEIAMKDYQTGSYWDDDYGDDEDGDELVASKLASFNDEDQPAMKTQHGGKRPTPGGRPGGHHRHYTHGVDGQVMQNLMNS